MSCASVAEFSDENKMDAENLAICFSPTLSFEKTTQQAPPDPMQLEDLVYARQSAAIRMICFLIQSYRDVFGVEEDESGTDVVDVPGPLYTKSLGLSVEPVPLEILDAAGASLGLVADDQLPQPSTPTLRSQPAVALTPTFTHVLRSQSSASQAPHADPKVRTRPSSQNADEVALQNANDTTGGGGALLPRADPLLSSTREPKREREQTKRRSANDSLTGAELSLATPSPQQQQQQQQQSAVPRASITTTGTPPQYAPCRQPAMSEKRLPPPSATSNLFVQNPNTAPGRIELTGSYSPNSEHIKSLESLNASLRSCTGTLPQNASNKRSSKELCAEQPMRERAPSDSRPAAHQRPSLSRAPLGASLPQATTSPQLVSISSSAPAPPQPQPQPPLAYQLSPQSVSVTSVMVPIIPPVARDPVREVQPPSKMQPPSPMQQLRTSTENLLNELAEAVRAGGISPSHSPRPQPPQIQMPFSKSGQSASLARNVVTGTATVGRKLVSSGSFREPRTSTVEAHMVQIASDDSSVPSPTAHSRPLVGVVNPESSIGTPSAGSANYSGSAAQLSMTKTMAASISRKSPAFGVASKPSANK